MVELINVRYVESDRKTCESDSESQAYYEDHGYEEVNRRNGISIMGCQSQMIASLDIDGATYEADIRPLVMSYFNLQRASRKSCVEFEELVKKGRIHLDLTANGEVYYIA